MCSELSLVLVDTEKDAGVQAVQWYCMFGLVMDYGVLGSLEEDRKKSLECPLPQPHFGVGFVLGKHNSMVAFPDP